MTVFVDDMRAPYHMAGMRPMIMCHMGADTTEELLQMADRIGVARKWLQHPGTWREHFDIALSKRKIAIELGAEEVTQREFVMKKKPELRTTMAGGPNDLHK